MSEHSHPLIELENGNSKRGTSEQAPKEPHSQAPDATKLLKQPTSEDDQTHLSEDLTPSKPILMRNVLIIGKVGVGKKTIANKLLGKQVLEVGTHAVETATRAANSWIRVGERGNYRYKLTIVDTGGLFVNNQESLRRSRNILRSVDKEGIGLLLFVIRSGGYFTMQDRKQFENIVKILQPSVANISALVITGCENLKVEKRREYVETFERDPVTTELAQFMKKGIVTVGFPDLSEQDEDLRLVYERKMKQDENNLRDLVENSGQLLSEQMVVPPKVPSVAGGIRDEFTTTFHNHCGQQ